MYFIKKEYGTFPQGDLITSQHDKSKREKFQMNLCQNEQKFYMSSTVKLIYTSTQSD